MVRALLARLWPFSPDEPAEQPDESSQKEDDGPTRSWDLIPNWQYEGRHVEGGGLTVDEQEQALEDIQAQAEAIQDAEEEEDPPG